jgi:general secretion pathway protein I
LSRSINLTYRRDAGFTLIEVLVALAVVAVSLTAIGSLVATNASGTRALDQRLALVETARAILTGLPDRDQIVRGSLSGEYNHHHWQADTVPFAADFIDPNRPAPWTPEAIVVRVKSPSGQMLRIDTVRLRRGGNGK